MHKNTTLPPPRKLLNVMNGDANIPQLKVVVRGLSIGFGNQS
eukprot:gene11152-3210_t